MFIAKSKKTGRNDSIHTIGFQSLLTTEYNDEDHYKVALDVDHDHETTDESMVDAIVGLDGAEIDVC